MNCFQDILQRFMEWGEKEDGLYASLVIGSQARENHPSDRFSDLDIVMVVQRPDDFLCSDLWLEKIGAFHISFVESTIGGALERRILFDGALDVDFVLLSKEDFESVVALDGADILKSGYRVLHDKIGLAQFLPPFSPKAPQYSPLSAQDFDNLVNDFWYHAVWTTKKWLRGELWTAKACVDSYMKQQLLTLVECHAHALHGPEYNSWHNGRFLEEWAEDWIVQKLAACYGRYERKDVRRALFATMELFRLVAVETAEKMGYLYPHQADRYAADWVIRAMET